MQLKREKGREGGSSNYFVINYAITFSVQI